MPVTIDLQSVIYTLVNTQHSPSKSYIEHNFQEHSVLMRGIIISLDLKLQRRTEERSYVISRPMHMAFCGNINVWVATPNIGDPFSSEWRWWNKIPIESWENTSNHDTCWASDGFRPLDRFYFDGCDKLNEAAMRDGHEAIAPNLINQYHGFLAPAIKNVLISHKCNDENRYTRELLNILPQPIQKIEIRQNDQNSNQATQKDNKRRST